MYTPLIAPRLARDQGLEWVVLRRDLADEVRPNDRYLDENVVPYLGDLGEEEDGEDAGGGTEASGDTAVADGFGNAHAPEVGDVLCPKRRVR